MKEYIAVDLLIERTKSMRYTSSEALKDMIGRMPRAKVVEKDKIIEELRYSSRYNTPCPEWVYNVVRNS
jgi:hypothetical protein